MAMVGRDGGAELGCPRLRSRGQVGSKTGLLFPSSINHVSSRENWKAGSVSAVTSRP